MTYPDRAQVELVLETFLPTLPDFLRDRATSLDADCLTWFLDVTIRAASTAARELARRGMVKKVCVDGLDYIAADIVGDLGTHARDN
jgi:hypothetical protein